MEKHVERMLIEQTELKEKIGKLEAFIDRNPIFGTLPNDERHDMKLQLSAMKMYSNILQHRIERAAELSK